MARLCAKKLKFMLNSISFLTLFSAWVLFFAYFACRFKKLFLPQLPLGWSLVLLLPLPAVYWLFRLNKAFIFNWPVRWLEFAASSFFILSLGGGALILTADFMRLAARLFLGKRPCLSLRAAAFSKAFGLALTLVWFAIGLYGARQPTITQYRIDSPMPPFKIVFFADTHLGGSWPLASFKKAVGLIMEQKPDLIVLGGDLINMDASRFRGSESQRQLARLQAPLGVYAVLGNHEYYSALYQEMRLLLADSGIILLADQYARLKNQAVIVGRDDPSRWRAGLPKRLSYAQMQVPSAPFVLVVDHQPQYTADLPPGKANLILSGHTHAGQFFPVNIMLKRVFKKVYGLYQEEGRNHIVTSGLGLWGAPIRLGTLSEAVAICIGREAL